MTGTGARSKALHRSAWVAFALLLAATPLLVNSSFELTLASQAGIAIILALSWNLLFGQAGLLSFGHAVYSGIGALASLHALRAMAAGGVAFPTVLLPLAGGAAAAALAVLLGYVGSRRGGLTFAMITLAIGELMHASAPLLPAVFGGEAGISADRTAGLALVDLSSMRALCALIAAWTFACALAMHAWTRTPLARMANAVRDNPARAAGIGIDPRRVRWLVTITAAFFAGIGGGLAALLFEIASAESVGTLASVAMLFGAYIGGTGHFFGPVLGAVLHTLMAGAASNLTPAWPVYLGVLFILVVMRLPGGLVSLFRHRPEVHDAALPARAVALIAILFGFIGIVETAYALTGNVGTLGAMLALLPGGRAGGLVASAVLFMIGRAAWDRLARRAARREARP